MGTGDPQSAEINMIREAMGAAPEDKAIAVHLVNEATKLGDQGGEKASAAAAAAKETIQSLPTPPAATTTGEATANNLAADALNMIRAGADEEQVIEAYMETKRALDDNTPAP